MCLPALQAQTVSLATLLAGPVPLRAGEPVGVNGLLDCQGLLECRGLLDCLDLLGLQDLLDLLDLLEQ